MAHIFFDFSLELCYPTAGQPGPPDTPRLHVYTCELHLFGPKMTVLVPVPVSADGTTPMYPHGTRAQVTGEGDVDGHTIFLKQPRIVPANNPSRRRPFAVFKAIITAWTWEAFGAMVAGGAEWPPSMNVGCLYDEDNEHLRGIDYVDEGTVVIVSAHLLGFADDGLDFKVHDVSLDPDVPPCTAGSFALPSVHSPHAQQALCHWLATYYPHAKPAAVAADAVDPVTATNSPSVVQSGPASAGERTPSARCTSADAASIRLALEQAFAFRDEGPIGQTPVDPRFRNDTPSEPESELSWLRGTPQQQQGAAPPARADAATREAIARARAAYLATPSYHESASDADWSFGATTREEALGARAYAESPAYGTPVPAPSITVAGARSAIRERIASAKYGGPPAGVPSLHEIIDLTQDSTDDEPIFELPVGGVKRCKWRGESGGAGRIVTW